MRPSSYLSDSDVKPNWAVVKSLIPYLMEYKGRVILAIIFLIAAKLAGVATPWVLKHIIDDLDSKAAMVAVPMALIFAYGLFRFLSSLLAELRDTVFAKVTERAMRNVAKNVFEHLHSLDLEFHLSRKTGGLYRDIERGTSGINFLLRFLIFNIIPTIFELCLVLGILWGYFSWQYCAIVVVVILIYIGFSVVVTEWRTKFIREVNDLDSRSNSRAMDSLLNHETVKFFNNEKREIEEYDSALALWESAKLKIRFSLSVLNSGQALIIAASISAMLFLAAFDVAEKRLTIGEFVMINAYMIQLFIPLNFLGFVYREVRQSLINIEKLFELLKVEPKVKNSGSAKALSVDAQSGCEVCFDNVFFSYNSDREILKGTRFHVRLGEKVAIVGASGAGKSTIAKLVFRFYDPTAGTVLINGVNIKDLTIDSVRSHIGVVPQDTVLFNDTIFYNIAYGANDKSEQEVKEAAERAHLATFIEKLPNGYQTLVGERGLKLSGGEKQRIAIARVLLKDPPILVFDEATSSLDTKAEKSISQALDDLATKRATIVIAHRLSTILNADRILVLADGVVIEEGNHADLLLRGGYYAQLWEAQSRDGTKEHLDS